MIDAAVRTNQRALEVLRDRIDDKSIPKPSFENILMSIPDGWYESYGRRTSGKYCAVLVSVKGTIPSVFYETDDPIWAMAGAVVRANIEVLKTILD